MATITRPIDIRTLTILDQALREHFTVNACAHCGGPEVFSKITPRARCVACGTVRELAQVAPTVRRWQCDRCRKFYRAVLGRAVCPACRDRERYVESRERQRTARRASRTSKTALEKA